MVVPDNQDGLRELRNATQLFAYLGDRVEILWNSGNRNITKYEFVSYFLDHIPAYEAVELLPQWPPVPGVLYHHRPVPAVTTGVIDQFLDFFSPATPHDLQLLKGLLLTPFWGGSGGQRPMFVLTHPPRTSPTEGRDTGRGIGKTTLCEMMAALAGGYVDFSGSATYEKVVTRLLSSEAFGKRMVRFDNIKSSRLASEDFERLITASILSGHDLYVGEGQRPNLLTYVLTMNGVALGDDLASRSVVIHLARPAHRARWREEVEQFIERHRWELIAEMGSILEAPPTQLSSHSRFGAWEAAVLSKLQNPDELATLLRTRSQQIDVDRDTAEMIEHALRARCGTWISATEPITIGSTEASEIILAVTGEKIPPNRLKAYFERIGFSGVTHRRTRVRGEWTIPRQFPDASDTPDQTVIHGQIPGIDGPLQEPSTMTGE